MAGTKRKAAEASLDPLIGMTLFASDLLASSSRKAEKQGRGGGFDTVLPVAGDNLDESMDEDASDDGSRYLASVRKEAAERPAVARVDYPYPTPPASARSVPAKRPSAVDEPSDEWKASFITRFKRLRETLREAVDPPLPDEGHILYTMPDDDSEHAWQAWIRGNKGHVDADDVRHLPKSPSASMLRLIPPATLIRLLEFYTAWITPDIESAMSGPSTRLLPPAVRKAAAARTASAAASPASAPRLLTAVDGQWLFALLASLPDFLAGEDIGTLRTLARICRAGAVHLGTLTLPVSEQDAAADQAASCWQVVAAVAGVWGQTDLWDA